MELPRFFVIKSKYSNKYLRVLHSDVHLHGFLQFTGEEVISPYTKIEVVMSSTEDGLVHLRSCYNNKFWMRLSDHHYWLRAAADEVEEDRSKWQCTLFKPIISDDGETFRFIHVELGHYACLWRLKDPYNCLFAGQENIDEDLCDAYEIIDWESLTIMPKHVAFKGDNGMYLGPSRNGSLIPLLEFCYKDINDAANVGNSVITTRDRSVHIKSDHLGKFWRCSSSNWILCDTHDSAANSWDVLFWPYKVDDGVALYNLGNKKFCARITAEGKRDCLSAAESNISREVRLQVEEYVASRKIYKVIFCLMDARIYDKQVLTMATGYASNESQDPKNEEVKLKYTNSKSSTWNTIVVLHDSDVKTLMQARNPIIAKDKVELSGQFNGPIQWGQSETSTTDTEIMYKVTVPPMAMVTVRLLATRASCDVPFSYSHCDTLINGREVSYVMNDGIYTGLNLFNYEFDVMVNKL